MTGPDHENSSWREPSAGKDPHDLMGLGAEAEGGEEGSSEVAEEWTVEQRAWNCSVREVVGPDEGGGRISHPHGAIGKSLSRAAGCLCACHAD